MRKRGMLASKLLSEDSMLARCARDLLKLFPVAQTAPKESATMEAWRPEGGLPATLVRWFISEWCNYSCPYCPQTHDRRAPKGSGMTAHAFDNFPLDRWLEAFDRHFGSTRLSMVLTGGEPTVDRKNITAFINYMSAKPLVDCIRVDTNAWWKPEHFADLDRSKLILMCTFHPSQAEEDAFIARIEAYLAAGFQIGMVNYVMDEANLPLFMERRRRFAEIGVVLHPNPLWQGSGLYKDDDVALLHAVLPEIDFQYRTQKASPLGSPCRFPVVAYEMDYKGWVAPGCMYDRSGSFFDETLPESPTQATPCPFRSCACLDKYSFLEGSERNTSLNPLRIYSEVLKDRAPDLFGR